MTFRLEDIRRDQRLTRQISTTAQRRIFAIVEDPSSAGGRFMDLGSGRSCREHTLIGVEMWLSVRAAGSQGRDSNLPLIQYMSVVMSNS